VFNREETNSTLIIFSLTGLVSSYFVARFTCYHASKFRIYSYNIHFVGGRCGHDRIVAGFTTTCAISAYHH